MSQKRPTMKDVALRAGVSQPTVSYVINGTANISDEVKEKVYRAIDELNYKPNYYARALKTNKSNIIGIIIPDIINQYYASIVNQIETALSERGFTVITGSTNYDKTSEENTIKHILNYDVAGVIVTYQMESQRAWKALEASNCEIVAMECGKKRKRITSINTDNHLGGYMATKYLLEQGKKRIAYVGQKTKIDALKDRCQGYIDAMKEHQLSDHELIYTTNGPGNKWKEGLLIGQQLELEKIEGIVVSSDLVAIGIIKKLSMENKKVPEDIAVVGYDDVYLSEFFMPALTTVKQPIEEMCELAVKSLLKEMDDQSADILLKPSLVIRETA